MVEYSIEITETAQRDLDEAFNYIAFHLENPQAAYDLTDAIYSGIRDLSTMPERFPAWKREPMKSIGMRFMILMATLGLLFGLCHFVHRLKTVPDENVDEDATFASR